MKWFCVFLLLFCAYPLEAAEIRYGMNFALELHKKKLTEEQLRKKIVVIENKSNLNDLPRTSAKNLHPENFTHLHRYVFTTDKILIVDQVAAGSNRHVPFSLLTLNKHPAAAGLMGYSGEKFLFTNRSKQICTNFAELSPIRDFLMGLGIEAKNIQLRHNKPKSCESTLTRQERLMKESTQKKSDFKSEND